MKRILIADDDFLARCALKAQIVSYSDEIEIIETDSGEDAVDVCRKSMPDMIFIDAVLSGMNGLVAARQIMEDNPGSKIFIVTEYDYFSYAQEAVSIGVKEYILKPISIEKTYRLLRKYLPDVTETDKPEGRSERESESRRLEELNRQARADAAGTLVFAGAIESSFVNKIMLNDMKAAQREGQQLLRGYFDRAESVEEFRENVIELFVMLDRSVRSIAGRGANGNLSENISDILKEEDKSVILKMAMLRMDTVISAVSESSAAMPNELRRRLLNYLNTNVSYNISLEDLSAALGVSATYLSRKFKDWMGASFSAYMTTRRMEYAKKLLLTTGDSVKSISAKVGYNDSNYFCRVFKKCMGQSPAYYRSVHL